MHEMAEKTTQGRATARGDHVDVVSVALYVVVRGILGTSSARRGLCGVVRVPSLTVVNRLREISNAIKATRQEKRVYNRILV